MILKKFDLGVLLMKARVLHEGHISVIRMAFEIADNALVILKTDSHKKDDSYTDFIFNRVKYPLNLYCETLQNLNNMNITVEYCLDDILACNSSLDRHNMRVTWVSFALPII